MKVQLEDDQKWLEDFESGRTGVQYDLNDLAEARLSTYASLRSHLQQESEVFTGLNLYKIDHKVLHISHFLQEIVIEWSA